jgi:hypothetical protein
MILMTSAAVKMAYRSLRSATRESSTLAMLSMSGMVSTEQESFILFLLFTCFSLLQSSSP